MLLWSSRKIGQCRKVFILILLISILFLQGCNPLFFEYPNDKGSFWVCDEPNFRIEYTYPGQNTLLEYDGKLQKVGLYLLPGSFVVLPMDQNGQSVSDSDFRLLDGSWRYNRGNMVLHIKTDNVFDGKYSEIVLVCKDKRPVKISMPAVIFAVGVLAGASYLIVKRHNNKKKGTQE